MCFKVTNSVWFMKQKPAVFDNGTSSIDSNKENDPSIISDSEDIQDQPNSWQRLCSICREKGHY